MGSVKISQPLDFDLNPACNCVGGDPELVFNSATVDVRPIVEVNVPTTGGGFPTTPQIKLTLTMDSVNAIPGDLDAERILVGWPAAGGGGRIESGVKNRSSPVVR